MFRNVDWDGLKADDKEAWVTAKQMIHMEKKELAFELRNDTNRMIAELQKMKDARLLARIQRPTAITIQQLIQAVNATKTAEDKVDPLRALFRCYLDIPGGLRQNPTFRKIFQANCGEVRAHARLSVALADILEEADVALSDCVFPLEEADAAIEEADAALAKSHAACKEADAAIEAVDAALEKAEAALEKTDGTVDVVFKEVDAALRKTGPAIRKANATIGPAGTALEKVCVVLAKK